MKRNLLLSLSCALAVFTSGYSQSVAKTDGNSNTTTEEVNSSKPKKQKVDKATKKLRKLHALHIKKNPFQKTLAMTKSERKDACLPPNKYYEQEWVLSMNPSLGKPTPENLSTIRENLAQERQNAMANGRIPGDGTDNNWVERGPNNVGGRTRAIIFDPTDATFNTVIAGGVSGGLWKNTNISSAASTWTRITTLPEHLNVQTIAVDPNNSSTWYVGTGESYVGGDVNGNGIWKTTNAGTSWTRVFGGGTVATTQSAVYNLQITSPSNAGVIRGYVTTVATTFGAPINSTINAQIQLVNDGAAPTDDACSALPAGSLTGKFALIRRGTCSFESKASMAQDAGAIGVIIMNNVAGAGPVGMAQDDLFDATIPTMMISKEDGDLLVANLTSLTGSFVPTQPGDFTGNVVSGVQNINDIAIKNNGGTSEIYVALGDGVYADARNNSLFSPTTYGLYKSVNGGTSWSLLTLPLSPSNNKTCPNDIEIAIDGKIWVSSTDSSTFDDGGGKVFCSADNGASFQLKHTVVGNGGGARVEIETSGTNANKLYVLSQLKQADGTNPTTEVQLLRTTDAFATAPTVTALPAGNETREITYGFTGQQAFYNLMIESDPTNDQIIFVGGIDLYRSNNGGTAWTTISNWTVDVHSDQHAMTFKPGNSNIAVFGNDGGVYYAGSLSTADAASSTDITARNNNYNTTQFVGMAVMPNGVTGVTGDYFVAGAQDNGSNYFPQTRSASVGATAGVNSSYEIQGGDGGKPLFAQDSDKYYITNYVYNDNMNYRTLTNTSRTLSDGTSNFGLFYPAMTLDSANDIVYSDYTGGASTTTYQVRRYTNIKSGSVGRTNLTNALLTSYPTALAVGKVTPSTLYVGVMNGKLLRVVNAATTAGTWTDITGSGFVGSISDIEFGANDSQIFVTMHNYGVNNIWYTPNAGVNWYNIEGNLPDLPVKAILQNPLNSAELMIGTELGVWHTKQFNPTATANQSLVWVSSFNGMSNVKVTDLDLQANSPTSPSAYNVYAATYGRGVFSGPLTAVSLSNDEFEMVGKSFNVYPTISNGSVTLTSNKYFGQTQLELFDLTGKKVYTDKINVGTVEQKINFGNLGSGNYILKLTGEGFIGTKKLIIE
ncbi:MULTISPECIES: PA domain-containing protein [unclassified Flavobacterium]|uniref:PA domain-containing protein n=1 Tax=unclassified Flavobacterium TaxID=196869 RepID=UPI00361C45FC